MILSWQNRDYSNIINTIINGNQAILLHGVAGIGKRILAQEVLRYLLCLSPEQDFACGKCRSCILHNVGNHPDIYVVADEENSTIKLEVLKKLLHESLSTTPNIAHKKIVYIPNFEQISKQGANSLLKTLEEPQSSIIFVMVVNEKTIVLPTILSRCVKISLHKPTTQQFKEYLSNQDQENIHNSEFWYKYFYNAPLATPILSDKQLEIILNCLMKPTINNIFAVSNEFDGKKVSFAIFIDFFYKWLCYIVEKSLTPDANKQGMFAKHDVSPLISKSKIDKLFDLQDRLQIFTNFLHHPINQKLHVENILFRYQQCFV